jgi:hypothetical protein
MTHRNDTATDRPSGEHFPEDRSVGAASPEQKPENPLEDAPLADRLEVDPERGDVKG